MKPRQARVDRRFEKIFQEVERNGYEIHTRGFPNALLTKPGEIVTVLFVGVCRGGKTRSRSPGAGFTKNQLKMIKLYEKIGAKILMVRAGE